MRLAVSFVLKTVGSEKSLYFGGFVELTRSRSANPEE
jgi:hypothetical protein